MTEPTPLHTAVFQAARTGDARAWLALWTQARREPLNFGTLLQEALSGGEPTILAGVLEHSDGRTVAAFCRKAMVQGAHPAILAALPKVEAESQTAIAGYVLREAMKRQRTDVILDFFATGTTLAAAVLDDFLFLAMRQGDEAVTEAFLASASCGAPTLNSSYTHAARTGRGDWLDRLTPHIQYEWVHLNALKEAVNYGQAGMIHRLMEHQTLLEKECDNLLRVGVNRGDLPMVKALLDHAAPGGSFLPIQAALGASHTALIELLLTKTDAPLLEEHLVGLKMWDHLDTLLKCLPLDHTHRHLANPARAEHLPTAQARVLACQRQEQARSKAGAGSRPRARC